MPRGGGGGHQARVRHHHGQGGHRGNSAINMHATSEINVLTNNTFDCPFTAELHGAGGGWRVLRGEVRQRDAARAEQAVHHPHGGAVHRHPRPGDTLTVHTAAVNTIYR